ncbi:hypothetical protein [Parenemella sanctibonifatiensis]|uniref:Uncharacterized protein n=1 Tax=Parenemella sanctibonifatiensis TaxID=2016505 RepID=A0A255EAM1_9ACTN|nr:hypothetical protein [Parenemella sanctibonifatiensis]OYN88617.1 hypothetical protein CGZ91_13500 [Parenemella sanctibonifatiensis]
MTMPDGTSSPDRSIVRHNAEPAHARAAARGAALKMRVITSIITVVLVVVLWFIIGQSMGPSFWWLGGSLLIASAVWLVVAVVRWQLAKRAAAAIPHGEPALVISRRGLELPGEGEVQAYAWEELGSFAAKSSIRGDQLIIQPRQGEPTVLPLNDLDTMPGDLDQIARALSTGRFGLDTGGLGA